MQSDTSSGPASQCPTFEQYAELFPHSKANTAADHLAFVSACERFGIDSPARMAPFCAQIGHESVGRTRFVENTNWNPSQLMAFWKWKFPTRAVAVEYNRKGPEAMANKAYANVNGNGDEASGDGWKFRGRGDTQLTGRGNYAAAEKGTGLPLVANPDLASDPSNSIIIAAWYWNSRGCNELADKGDFMEITRRINGGTIGYPQREELFRKAQAILSGDSSRRLDRTVFANFMAQPEPTRSEIQ